MSPRKKMKIFFVFLLGIHMTGAAIHNLQYFYTATSGLTNFPKFVSLGMFDGQQIDYYDSNIKRTIPKTEWFTSAEGPEYWDGETQKCIGTEQVYSNNIDVVKSRFNQSGGIHTFQQMYGCTWDDKAGDVDGFDEFGYDGEDFISLDLKNLRYVTTVQEALITQVKLNNDKALLESKKHYRTQICIEWLKKYLQYGKSTAERQVSPQVSLLQKDSSSPVTCHATGFYPSGVTITWMKNGEEHHEDVELGELLPNEDGTFQKTSTLTVTPDEWKNNKFSCEVEHQRKTKTAKDIITNNGNTALIGIIIGVVAAVVLLVVIGGVGYMVYKKKTVHISDSSSGFKPVNTSDGGSDSSNSQTGA